MIRINNTTKLILFQQYCVFLINFSHIAAKTGKTARNRAKIEYLTNCCMRSEILKHFKNLKRCAIGKNPTNKHDKTTKTANQTIAHFTSTSLHVAILAKSDKIATSNRLRNLNQQHCKISTKTQMQRNGNGIVSIC